MSVKTVNLNEQGIMINQNIGKNLPADATNQDVISWAYKKYGINIEIHDRQDAFVFRFTANPVTRQMYEHVMAKASFNSRGNITPEAFLQNTLEMWLTSCGIRPAVEGELEKEIKPQRKRVRMGKWKVNKNMLG